ncbi:MAG: hypothetical protein V4604_06615 [Bacteroidota bacterium]
MLKELNSLQYYGLECPDMDVFLQNEQDNFGFNGHSLQMYLYRYSNVYELSFSYRQLKDVLRKPSEFGL